jgi:hypothetical protein
MLMEGDFTGAGYRFVMNQNADKRAAFRRARRMRNTPGWMAGKLPIASSCSRISALPRWSSRPCSGAFSFLHHYEDYRRLSG